MPLSIEVNMSRNLHVHLSRREREVMDIAYKLGELDAVSIIEEMVDPPGYSAVRSILRILSEKGHLTYRRNGRRYVYKPTVPNKQAKLSALMQLLSTYFGGHAPSAMNALLNMSSDQFTEEDLDHLAAFIEQHREGGQIE